jgi:D-glycero-D-manno-heptose 1,7-bisphosphate phosphatase
MALKAAHDFGLELCQCFMVGDKLLDIGFARSFHARGAILLGTSEYISKGEEKLQADFIAADLLEAANWIIQRDGGEERYAQAFN